MKEIDLGKMQEELNAFLKKQFGDGVNVSIGANIIPTDKLNEKQKEIESGTHKQEGTKQ
jgi:hypothetical protein